MVLWNNKDWQLAMARDLAQPKSRPSFLIAFSGGADSTALLLNLLPLRDQGALEIFACHVDHGLRATSFMDAQFCHEFCQIHQIPFALHQLEAWDGVGSVENWAREQRYAALQEMRIKWQCQWILTAHHRFDQRETLVMRLERGTSLAGLRGIYKVDPKRNLWRPWLNAFEPTQIRAYLNSQNQSWCEDLSNQDQRFRRNAWRQAIPRLWPDQRDRDALNHLAALGAEVYGLVQQKLLNESEFENEDFWQMDQWRLYPEFFDYWVEQAHCFKPEINRETWAKIWRWAMDPASSRIDLPGSWRAIFHGSRLEVFQKPRLSPQVQETMTWELSLDSNLSLKWAQKNYLFRSKYMQIGCVSDSPFCAYISANKLVKPLEVRTRREGDLFSPFPNQYGSRKLKKFWNEKRIPECERDEWILVCCESEVVWIPGLAISGCFGVQDLTKPCWKLELYVSES